MAPTVEFPARPMTQWRKIVPSWLIYHRSLPVIRTPSDAMAGNCFPPLRSAPPRPHENEEHTSLVIIRSSDACRSLALTYNQQSTIGSFLLLDHLLHVCTSTLLKLHRASSECRKSLFPVICLRILLRGQESYPVGPPQPNNLPIVGLRHVCAC